MALLAIKVVFFVFFPCAQKGQVILLIYPNTRVKRSDEVCWRLKNECGHLCIRAPTKTLQKDVSVL